jgi:hypothetical protein
MLVVLLDGFIGLIAGVAEDFGAITGQLRLDAFVAHTGKRDTTGVVLPP